jgi:peptide-methionine (S)-S-oxide reductase
MLHRTWLREMAVLLFALQQVSACAAQAAAPVPPPALDNPRVAGALQSAVLAGGCFWGVQGVFEHLKGVQRVLSGYSGGQAGTAHYEIVGRGRTGHAESVQITFDPKEVSYGQILQVFFAIAHDPTQLDRQGPDVGPQYRSVIFYADDAQKRIAEAYIKQLEDSKVFPAPIVTRLQPLTGFYAAEGYHQDFLLLNPYDPYIVQNDLPKITRFRSALPDLYRAQPVRAVAARL